MCSTTRSGPGSTAQIAQNNLGPDRRQAGPGRQRPAPASSPTTSTVGDFDIAQFAWGGDAFPLSGCTQIYRTKAESNFGKISSPEIDAKIERDASESSIPTRRARSPTRLDKLVWAEGVQPAADPVARKRRRAKHFGELRRVRPRPTRTTPRSAS